MIRSRLRMHSSLFVLLLVVTCGMVASGCTRERADGASGSGDDAATAVQEERRADAAERDAAAREAAARESEAAARERERARAQAAAEVEAAAREREAARGDDLAKRFASLERQLGGSSGIAWLAAGAGSGAAGEPTVVGSLTSGVAWSTSKVPIAVAVVQQGASSSDRADVRAAMTVSDNDAARRLWARLGDGATASAKATRVLRASGDRTTKLESRTLLSGFTPFGQTAWSLDGQVRFMAGVGCTRAGRDVLEQMSNVTSSQRWGLGRLGERPKFKGGWGPATRPGVSSGYLNRQLGLVSLRGQQYAVAIMSVPASGSHEAGTANLDRIAQWFDRQVATTPPIPRSNSFACDRG